MAYNYYPYQQTYYQPYQQTQYQPVQAVQQAAQTQQPATQSPYYTGRIWVSGRAEADFYPVAPNNAVDLWDRNGKTLYKKMADATGKPTIVECDVIERTQTAPDGVSEQDGKLPAYATKEELSAIVGVVSTLKSDIDTMKCDMYGIAGKKKAKKEVTDDAE